MEEKIEKKIKIRTILIGTVLIFFVAILALMSSLYGFGIQKGGLGKITGMFPFPVAIVDGRGWISLCEMKENLDSVERFYRSQDFSEIGLRVDFDTEDGKKRLKVKEKKILNKLIENEIIRQLAKRNGVTITEEMAKQNISREMNRFGNESDVAKNLERLYGWDMDDFIEKLVKPDMYRDELERKMRENDQDFVRAKERMQQVRKELNEGKNFSEIAEKYSEAESSKNGGELGWFSADQIIPEVMIYVFAMQKGDISDIIESPLGFHLIKINDRKKEDGVDKVKVSQVLIRTKDFSGWLTEKEKKTQVYIPLKEYYWDQERGMIDFSSEEMRDFERKLNENSSGDASVLF